MQTYYTTQTWGYKILSRYQISFYHVLIDAIPHKLLYDHIPHIASIQKQTDGTVTFFMKPQGKIEETIEKMQAFFNEKSLEFLDTPRFQYKIPATLGKSLLSWSLAFEGCLALLLLTDTHLNTYLSGKWKYIPSKTGGLYLAPFTLFLYKDYSKIVHPISIGNYIARKTIEQTTATTIRKIFRRMEEAQEGLEGLALLSMVEEKTQLSSKAIASVINEKSFQIPLPVYSSFFTDY